MSFLPSFHDFPFFPFVLFLPSSHGFPPFLRSVPSFLPGAPFSLVGAQVELRKAAGPQCRFLGEGERTACYIFLVRVLVKPSCFHFYVVKGYYILLSLMMLLAAIISSLFVKKFIQLNWLINLTRARTIL